MNRISCSKVPNDAYLLTDVNYIYIYMYIIIFMY